MKIEQGSEEWKKWRMNGIGSSDAAAVMGISPYLTPLQLWKVKTGKEEDDSQSHVMVMGHIYEEKARAFFEMTECVEIKPCLIVHPKFPELRVSVDGFSVEEQRGVEFKYVGRDKFNRLKSGEHVMSVAPHHYCQMQYMMAVSGLNSWDYVPSICDDSKQEIIESIVQVVDRNQEYIDRMIPLIREFWHFNVCRDIPPPLSDMDWKEMSDVEPLASLCTDYVRAKEIEKSPKKMKSIKEKIIPHLDHPRCVVGLMKMAKNKKGIWSFRVTTPEEERNEVSTLSEGNL